MPYYFAEAVDFGPVFLILYLLVFVVIFGVPVLAIGFFFRTVYKKSLEEPPSQDAAEEPPSQDAAPTKHLLREYAILLLASIAFLVFYFLSTATGPFATIPYLVIATLLIMKMNSRIALYGAITVILTLAIFVYNHYPQFTGRSCGHYYYSKDCRTPRFQLK